MPHYSKVWSLFFLLLTISLVFYSCQQTKRIEPPPPGELFKKYQKSVVLIRTRYYVELRLSNGLNFYFSKADKNGSPNFLSDMDEAKNNPLEVYGTGFFISHEGQIATNRHVVYPELEDLDVLGRLKSRTDALMDEFKEQIAQYQDTLNNLENYYDRYNEIMSISEVKEWMKKLEEVSETIKIAQFTMQMLDFDPARSDMEIVHVSVEVAYENTFADEHSGFNACEILSKSENKRIDLALIQLRDQTTPEKVTSVFNFDDHNPNIVNGTAKLSELYDISSPLEINKNVYMIGYNYGLDLGSTSDGLKVQFTQGTVSQESDQYRVLYSIPALQGSSGSPVIDQWGNLVAVNYAGIRASQSFNYGVLAKHLKQMVRNGPEDLATSIQPRTGNVIHSEKTNPPNEPFSYTKSFKYEEIIKDFINVEDRRDFESIYSYFSPDIKRYWNLYFPSEDELRNLYI